MAAVPPRRVLLDGTTWDRHGGNRTDSPRRSIQGAFIPQDHTAADELSVAQVNWLPADAKRLLRLKEWGTQHPLRVISLRADRAAGAIRVGAVPVV